MKRKNTDTTKLSVIQVLHRCFGKQDGQSPSGFVEEIADLSDDEQLELAREAARSLGLTKSQVRFGLK
ncbi:hypothetical protein LCGC14_2266560 [marine sediment metagenome]|uniref:Uncharacterized protein n=1 Tax=marine sediment metagenome TaxID=412755 RepID=A0A0F9FAJ2_9ZZZZ